MSNVLTARIRFFIFPPPSPHRDNNSPWAADRALIIEKYPRYRMESLLDTLKNSHQKGERRLPTKQYPSSSSSSKFPTTRLQPLDTSPRIITFRTSKSGGDINGRGSKGGGGSGSYFFAYFSTGRSFTGNIAKFIGLRFAMIFYASRPVVGAGPPMAGPSTSPHTFGPRGRGTEQASKEAEGERDVRHNLAIIPLFIPVRPLLSGHLNLLNTRRLVHFIKPRVCTRTIHFHLALVSSYPFPSSFFFFSLLFREGTPFFLSLARRRVGEQGTPQDVESLTRFHGNGRESNKRPRPRDTRLYGVLN